MSLTLACSGASSSGEWEAERTVAGDTTTVYTLTGQVWPSEIRLVEDVTIGLLNGPPELMFGEVTRLAEDREGGIYFLDAQGPEIHHFDGDGEFVRTIGGAGEGPGEYGRLTLGMVVDANRVLHIHAWGRQRLVRYDEAGRLLDPWTFNSAHVTTAPGSWLFSDAPGRVLVTTRVDREPALLVLEDGRLVDTLPVPRLPGVPSERGGAYRIESHWSWHPSGYFVVGVNNEYSLDVRRPDGVLRIQRNVEALPVHPEEAESLQRRFEWLAMQPQYQPPEGVWVPSTMPPFSGIDVGRDGRIWVRRNTHPVPVAVAEQTDGPPPVGWAQPFLYDVFEADGTFLGEVRFPQGFEPHLFGDNHVWGVRRGEFDEEYVVRMSIEYD